MNSDYIIKTVADIKRTKIDAQLLYPNDVNAYNKHMLDSYKDFYDKYPNLFDKIMDDSLTDITFKYMLNQLKQIESKRISQHDASIKVGSLLVDTYVKPVVKQ